jgi:DNA-binding beta-propeller fold protein YncE
MKHIFLYAALSGVALALAGCGGGSNSTPNSAAPTFKSLSTFKVTGDVAEIVSASPDGNTLIYTDSERRELGFLDASNAASLSQSGTLGVNGEPTSVAFTKDGRFALAVVAGANELNVVNTQTRASVRRIALGGQPDSIAISPDGTFAAIAIENQRQNEDAPMPQAPAGYVVVVKLTGEPAAWTTKRVNLAGLPGLRFPTDPEPEFVAINAQNQAAVTLQENNAVAIINLQSGTVVRTWSAGSVTHAADTKDDGKIAFTDTITNSRREPDGIAWTPGGNLITANEGDYDLDLQDGQFTGGRGFTIFSPTGTVLFDVADGLEQEAAKAGVYADGRSDNKGVEPEGVEVARISGRALAFIALERADAVAVYDISSENAPRFVQILKTGKSPEGVKFLPNRNLLVTANEGDGTVSVFGL